MTLRIRPVSFSFVVTALLVAGVAALWTEDWLGGLAVLALAYAWQVLPISDGPPILFIALTMHWIQIVIGLYYHALTGHTPLAMAMAPADYREMVELGLGAVMMITTGITLGDMLVRDKPEEKIREYAISDDYLTVYYLAAVVFRGAIQALLWASPSVSQAVYVLTFLRLGLFYIVLRRFVSHERYGRAAFVLGIEVALGFTGYFSEFKDPLLVALVVFFELFDRRRVAHWVGIGGLLATCLVAGVLWMSIRGDLRSRIAEGRAGASPQERLGVILDMSQSWWKGDSADKLDDIERFVDRVWDVYYPALALARVPSVMPHENGAILMATLQHIATPRVLFPDKKELESDSMSVRKYTGLMVAGPEQGTSIAFGYAIQSYIDFGVPLMFLPILGFGVLAGVSYRWLITHLRHYEIAIAVTTVIFWLSISPWNRAWARLLGLFGTMLIYLGGTALAVDKYLLWGEAKLKLRQEVEQQPFASGPSNSLRF